MTKQYSVTIGIPAYNRPQTLARALKSLENQVFKEFKVIIQDDCSPSHDLRAIANDYSSSLNIEYIRNKSNEGLINNCLKLLDRVDTEYFMWMADDDEYSETYLSSLTRLICSDDNISTSVGHWHLLVDEQTNLRMDTANFPDEAKFLRMMKYMWKSDDAFFYGLHRTRFIKKVFFHGYWWPNKKMVANWCYVPLFQIVLSGRVVITDDTSAIFINHQYTEKDYVSERGGIASAVKWCLRRINIYYYYLMILIKNRELVLLIPAAPFVLVCALRDVGTRLVSAVFRKRTT